MNSPEKDDRGRTHKRCIGCGVDKDICEYNFKVKAIGQKQSYCKECEKIRCSNYYKENREKCNLNKNKWKENNKEKVYASYKEYALKHPEKGIERSAKYRRNHPEKIKSYNKEYKKNNKEFILSLKRDWYNKNKDKINEQRRIDLQNRILSDPVYALNRKLNLRMANGMNRSLKKGKEGHSWEKLIGYTVNDLKNHIEGQFLSGMTWDNHGQWHIDHIIPKKAFNFNHYDDPDFKRCWSLNNLQPLWGPDNLKKRDKLYKPFQPSLLFECSI